LRDFRKLRKYQISRKSVQWEPSSMRTEGRTDERTYIAFRNFANAPKKRLPIKTKEVLNQRQSWHAGK